MEIHHFSSAHSLLNTCLSSLRDKNVQKDAFKFRLNLKRIGEMMAYEISKTLAYQKTEIETPFAKKQIMRLSSEILVACILRAGLPLYDGILSYFDQALSTFITPVRGSLHITSASVDGVNLILADPMLATGSSMLSAYHQLQGLAQNEGPIVVHLVSVVASKQGVEKLQQEITANNVHLWVVEIDDFLNKEGYIVPGLGDAGDLAFGL